MLLAAERVDLWEGCESVRSLALFKFINVYLGIKYLKFHESVFRVWDFISEIN